MGKEREGKHQAPKARPSGAKKTKGEVIINSVALDHKLDLEERYGIDPDSDTIIANVPVRHPNRNVDKGDDRKVTQNKKKPAIKFADGRLKTTLQELDGNFSKDMLNDLAGYTSDHCISIYMPTHLTGVKVNEQADLIMYKNAIQKVNTVLKEKGVRHDLLSDILKPALDLLKNSDFWQGISSPGVVFFIANGFFKYRMLPVAPTEQVMVNSSFLLGPLVPLIMHHEYFYVLVLSKKRAKVFRADNFGIKYIEIKELPNGLDDVIHFENKDDQNLFRTGSSGAGGGASYHGVGSTRPDEKENISMYLEEVDRTLRKEVLQNENVPLLLAGVDYIVALYKNVSHYNFIYDKYLAGSLENADERQLYQQAKALMNPFFHEREMKALENYGNHSATLLTSSSEEELIAAAHYSRVAQLFVEENAEIWGTFHELDNALTIHRQQENNDDNLLDKAVLRTLLNGGEVFMLNSEKMPTQSPLAGVLRYAV